MLRRRGTYTVNAVLDTKPAKDKSTETTVVNKRGTVYFNSPGDNDSATMQGVAVSSSHNNAGDGSCPRITDKQMKRTHCFPRSGE
ncbi:unnamed protein product [Plutella xylostella]|uniref:(diamondback moth) hypothetical protein n=1 Tax=Plutella xylostella TaxID=51655 RepID=A0A8S4DJU4_PLUXY|nr:unnamed protein product [Plutella xylostella]